MYLWRIVLLAMIWGSSFLFQRIAVPEVGPGVVAFGRLALAAVALVLLLRLRGGSLEWRRLWREYLLLGAFNSALPFFFFAYAAGHLPAGYLAVLNATVPMFTVLLAWSTTGAQPTASKLTGVVVGISGVAVLAGFGGVALGWSTLASFGAGLGAALCYAYAALRSRRHLANADPLAAAAGSLLGATAVLVPLVAFTLPTHLPSQSAVLSMLMLGLVCTGLAYVLYFWLLRHAGSERAVTVTFLVPVFAQLWGAMFLHETLTPASAFGFSLVLVAMALVFERLPILFRRSPVPLPPPAMGPVPTTCERS